MSSSPTSAFDAATVAALTDALSGQAEPCAVSHLPALDREATAYLAEVEQATGKTGLFDRLLTLFINDLARHQAGISAASAAADWSALGRAAHGIKGSAATIGARRIEHVSRALEASCRAEGTTPDPAELTALAAQLVSLCDAFRVELGPA